MVSAFIFFSDEAIEESNERMKHINYILSPNGGMMVSVCIPPVTNLFLHLTDTLKSENIVLNIKDLIENTSKEIVYSGLSNIYNKSFGSYLKDNDIDKWLEDSEIYIAIDSKENMLGYLRIKHLNINHLSDENQKYNLFVNTENFVFLSDIASIKKGTGSVLMNYLHYNINVSDDIILRAHNKTLIPYYNQFGYTQIVSDLLKGNYMIRRS